MHNEIRVWDPLVRIFHWSLVLAFAVVYLSGEEESNVHIYSGYAVAGLISFRLVWGVIGSKYARFSDFVRSPRNVLAYLKAMLAGNPKRYLGHNPAGGAMIVALLLGLAVTTYSGLEVYAIEEGAGPLAAATDVALVRTAHADDEAYEHEEGEDEFWEEFWEEIHEASANFVLLLVFLHIAGVIFASRQHGENLVKSMVTGRKKAE
jgi:cytochrome b